MEKTLLSGLRVLVAHNNPDIQRFFGFTLRRFGARASLVEDGQSAVEMAIAEPFDVILMDIDLPVVDGCEATKHLREHGYRGAILALTESASHFWAVTSAGFNGYLRQPIGLRQLIDSLAPFRFIESATPVAVADQL